jgi:hypothetical protein
MLMSHSKRCYRPKSSDGKIHYPEEQLTTMRGGLTVSLEDHPQESSQVKDRCNQCGQQLVEIDNRGERLVGCLTCNLWAAEGKESWVRLSEEDLRALHELRHKGSR